MEQDTPWQGRKEVEAVATRLVDLCLDNQFLQAQNELYDPCIERIEVDGRRTTGLVNTLAQEERFLKSVLALQTSISQLAITDQYFSVLMSVDVTLKTGEVKKIEEICVYRVVKGKIVFEQFFR